MDLIHIVHPLNACQWDQKYEMYLAQELNDCATDGMCEAIRKKKSYKILDNGCYENSMVNLDVLFAQAEKIGATEIILPDIMGDFYGTLRATTDALEWAAMHGKTGQYKFMAVCQGRTWDEYEACVQLFKGINEISCFGLPKKFCREAYTEHAGEPVAGQREASLARVRFAENVAQITRKDIHLLGLSWSVLELPGASKFVRTCDTNNIVENIKKGCHPITPWQPRSEQYSLHVPMTEEQLFKAQKHAVELDTYINGSEGFR